MWYRFAQGFGGGILSPVEMKIQQALIPSQQDPGQIDEPMPENQDDIVQNPIAESTEAYEKRLWDTLVNRSDSVKSDDSLNISDGNFEGEGPAIEADEARRLSPYHQNPEETTMEEQLEAVRQQNVNSDSQQSMSSTEGGRGEALVRGEFPYASGKGWTGYEDLPSDKSWA